MFSSPLFSICTGILPDCVFMYHKCWCLQTAGTLKLIGTEFNNVAKELSSLLENPEEYDKMSKAQNPYGDGYASERILDAIAEWAETQKEL